MGVDFTPSNLTGFFLSKGGVMCMQGPLNYMPRVLARYQAKTCTTRFGFLKSTVAPGTCADNGYNQNLAQAYPCFPRASIWSDKAHAGQAAGHFEQDMVDIYKAKNNIPANK